MPKDRKHLFYFITETGFALDDVILYLDTHPDDEQALEYYETYRKLYQQAVNEYTRLYGPLNADDVNSCNYWAWVTGPWPWEVSERGVRN